MVLNSSLHPFRQSARNWLKNSTDSLTKNAKQPCRLVKSSPFMYRQALRFMALFKNGNVFCMTSQSVLNCLRTFFAVAIQNNSAVSINKRKVVGAGCFGYRMFNNFGFHDLSSLVSGVRVCSMSFIIQRAFCWMVCGIEHERPESEKQPDSQAFLRERGINVPRLCFMRRLRLCRESPAKTRRAWALLSGGFVVPPATVSYGKRRVGDKQPDSFIRPASRGIFASPLRFPTIGTRWLLK